MKGRPFLTAEWRHLAMLNYVVDPSALTALVPRGTVLDEFYGRTYVTLVGFLFLDTRVMGVPVPFHRNFEEVNLRFYVKRVVDGRNRRGVVFVKEFVPRLAIAAVARGLYGENYAATGMGHELCPPERGGRRSVSYRWNAGGRRNELRVAVDGEPESLLPGSEAEFIAEHYWGYSVRRDGSTWEYEVTHPPWRAAAAAEASLDCDVARVYGAELAPFLTGEPASAFLADGSAVAVSRGVRLSV